MNKATFIFFSTISTIFVAACGDSYSGSSTSDSNSSVSDIVTGAISGAVSGTSASATMAYQFRKKSILNYFLNIPLFNRAAYASTSCPTVLNTSCSGSSITLTYNSCGFGSSKAVWNGSQFVTFTSGSCAWVPAANAVFTRTFGTNTTRLNAGGTVTVALDTTNTSGFSSSVSGGATITIGSSWPNRTIAINGIHLVASGYQNSGSKVTIWDHTISTTTSLSVVSASGTETVNGIVLLQHNLAKYTGTATLNNLVFTNGCVFPTSGSITTVFSTSSVSTETITFSSTCGVATRNSASLTLSHVF